MRREIRVVSGHRKIGDLRDASRRGRLRGLHHPATPLVIGVRPDTADVVSTFECEGLELLGKAILARKEAGPSGTHDDHIVFFVYCIHSVEAFLFIQPHFPTTRSSGPAPSLSA